MVFDLNLVISVMLTILIFTGILGLLIPQTLLDKISCLIISYLSSMTLLIFLAIIYQKQALKYTILSILMLFIANLLMALKFLKK